MHCIKWLFCCGVGFLPAVLLAQAADEFTADELSIVELIKAKNRTEDIPADKPSADAAAPVDIANKPAEKTAANPVPEVSETASLAATSPTTANTAAAAQEPVSYLPIAYIDIDLAFNEHPRTQAVKKQIDQKIKSKQHEVQNAREVIAALEAENTLLGRQLAELKPFYQRIITDQLLLPAVPENTDELAFTNLLNRLSFAGSEMLSTSPLLSPMQLEELTQRIAENKKIIAEKLFFIDNYKYQTREEILQLEQEEVNAILQDIYNELKTFAQKRNIGAVVRKDEILYGQQPVNVTQDFVYTLKKSKKYRKK